MKKWNVTLRGFLLAGIIGTALLVSWSTEKKSLPPSEGNKIPFTGTYVWHFEIPDKGVQTSSYTFYPYSIQYQMEGPAFNTAYTQVLVSYDPASNRCITTGRGGTKPKDSIYFVMFFKDITDSSVTIYKHECGNGRAEAEEFEFPPANATADHGWNVYKKNR